MAPGIHFNVAPPVEHEVCDESSIYRLNDGGMDLSKANLPAKGWLPELTPLFRDKTERKAHACLRVRVVEDALTTGKTFKIAKCPFLSFLKAGFLLTDSTNVITVASIDTSHEAYDVVTATANLVSALTVGQVLPEAKGASDAKAKHIANFASFGWRNVETEDSVTFVGRVFGILEDELYIPFTEDDKAALGDRFMFI